MGKILLEDIEIYAYHGQMSEENKIGSKFLVNLELDTAFESACETDNLNDTFNYEIAYEIVNDEMKKSSSLLEHVASQIIKRLFNASPLIWAAKVIISKINPPFNGNVKAVSIELHQERNQ